MRYRVTLGLRHGRYVRNLWDTAQNRLVDWFIDDSARLVCDSMNRGDVDARYVTPKPVLVAYRIELRRAIRSERLAMSGNVLSLTTPKRWNPITKKMEDGPIARWQKEKLKPYTAGKRQAEKQLKAIEKTCPTPEFFKPKGATAKDKRIARQYKPDATPVNFRFFRARDAEWYADRHETHEDNRKYRADVKAHKAKLKSAREEQAAERRRRRQLDDQMRRQLEEQWNQDAELVPA